jgi:2,3-bisphosphoglycerate-dependent phosphoglycerate mutase
MKGLFSFILLLSITITTAFAQNAPGEVTTFILVRHAEKVDDSHDSDLSAEGYERAALLAIMLENIKFDAVYSTPLIRTTETARAVAEKHKIDIIEYDHRKPEELTSEWIEKHRGEYVLIAGHSNSTPTFANALLGREHFKEKFDESDYGNILIVTISGDGERHILHIRF